MYFLDVNHPSISVVQLLYKEYDRLSSEIDYKHTKPSVANGPFLSCSFPPQWGIDCKYSLALRCTLTLPQMLPLLQPFCFSGIRILWTLSFHGQ